MQAVPPPSLVPASAVHDMTVAEVRKALGKIRQLWSQSSPTAPLFICLNLVRDKTIAEFCTEFVYGHHLKRHRKSTQQRLLTPAGAIPAAACDAVGIAGPKGDAADPYPFTPGWRPRELPTDASKWWDRGIAAGCPLPPKIVRPASKKRKSAPAP